MQLLCWHGAIIAYDLRENFASSALSAWTLSLSQMEEKEQLYYQFISIRLLLFQGQLSWLHFIFQHLRAVNPLLQTSEGYKYKRDGGDCRLQNTLAPSGKPRRVIKHANTLW